MGSISFLIIWILKKGFKFHFHSVSHSKVSAEEAFFIPVQFVSRCVCWLVCLLAGNLKNVFVQLLY